MRLASRFLGRIAVGLLVLASQPTEAQRASNWRVFRVADGLPEATCLSVTVGPHTRVLARHPYQPYVTLLDGYSATKLPAPATNARRVYQSPAGQIWAPTHKGLLELRDGSWTLHEIPEIASRFAASPQRPMEMPIRPVKQGMVLFLLPDALMVFYARDPAQPRVELIRSVTQTGLGEFRGFCVARDQGLWVAGSNGLAKVTGPARSLRPDNPWQEFHPDSSLGVMNFGEPCEYGDGTLSMLAESKATGNKAIVSFDRNRWQVESLSLEHVRFGWRGPNRMFWAVTPTGLFHWEQGRELAESEEVSARQYFDVALEPGGIFWLATSDGLFRYDPPVWRTPPAASEVESLVHCVTGDRAERLWFIAGNALHSLHNEERLEYPLPTAITRPPPQALYLLRTGVLLMETAGKLFTFRPESKEFAHVATDRGADVASASSAATGEPNQQTRVLGEWGEGSVCLQVWEPESNGKAARLMAYDGSRMEPVRNAPEDPLFRTGFLSFFAAQNGDLWLGAEEGTAWFHEDKWRTFGSADQAGPGSATSFIEIPGGKIWCAARDRIWEFDGRGWTDLPRNFDRVNSVLRSRDGIVWVGSNNGCHRFFQGTGVENGAWVENGIEEGLASATIRQVFEDSRGRIWAATSRGLSLYYPTADPDPPKASAQELKGTERDLSEGATINLTFQAIDKWKFTPRERLLYSYRLDQREWTDFSDVPHASFSDLLAGKHYFQVRALDRNCNVDLNPARLEFGILLPWYKEGRLVLILAAGLGVALFFAGVAVNRHLSLVRSYTEVERKVAERTRELEAANRELLQSQKMTALGTLAAGIAHDFNNILSIVKGSAQIIEMNLDDREKVRTRVDRIKTVVEQGSGIVKAMLGFSRDSGQQSSCCDINSVVEDTVKLLGDRFLREVHVLVQLAPDLPQPVVSKDLVQQILLNFIFNASEAMVKRKEVILGTRTLTELPDELVRTPTRASEYVAISVTDFGCGIAPEVLPRIFEPFFTTKAFSARRGTGLGLSMVYEFAKKLDAGLAVRSVVNEGSTFTVILPVSPQPQPETRSVT